MNRLQQFLPIAILCLWATFSGSCGYYNPNMLPQDEQGPPINLYVPIWANNTNELGLESDVHNAISDWLIQSKRITLTNQKDAEYILNGTILSVNYPGLSYNTTDQATALKVVLTVRYAVKEKLSDKIIWERSGHVLEETYSIGSSASQTDTNKKAALDTLTDDLAEQIYIRAFRALAKHQRRNQSTEKQPENNS